MATKANKEQQWWKAAKGERHAALFKWVRYCGKELTTLRQDTMIFASVANNFAPTGNDEYDYAIRSAFRNKIRDNILQPAIDTAVSMIALARTSPQYLTMGGEWLTSRKAEKKSRVLQSQMYELGLFKKTPQAFRQACEGGTGWLVGLVGADGMPSWQRALHNEIYWDPEDGRYGNPRMLAWVHFEDREELIKQHPKFKTQLADSAGPTSEDYSDFFIRKASQADRVRVVYAWRLPTVDRGDDGVFVKCVSNATLVERAYTRRRHRIVRVMFAERDQGFAGQGLVERMLPAQMHLTDTDAYVATTQRLGSNAKTYVFQNSKVKPDQISNAAVQVIECASPDLMPQTVVTSATPPDLAAQRESIKRDAYDAQGFGDNTVTGDVNKGLASGEAVRKADDVKVRRFLNPARGLEFSYLDAVVVTEDMNDECAELDPNYTVKVRHRSGRRTWLKTSKWSDLQFDADSDATIQMFPISAQATTASDRWERVDDWIARGFVSKPMAMDLLEFPDTAAFETLENADLDLIHEQLDNLIELDSPNVDMLLPVPWQDPDMAAYYAKKAALIAWRLGAPDEVLMRFERYLSECRDIKAKAAKAMQPPTPTPAALGPNAAAAAAMQQQQLTAGPVAA